MKPVELGRFGEKSAVRFLRKNRYRIVAKNVHVSHNEIDIIAKNKEYIVFIEVKTRSVIQNEQSGYGSPASAVTYQKRQRTLQAARSWLRKCKYKNLQPRFDVIEVYVDKESKKILRINQIINAFGA